MKKKIQKIFIIAVSSLIAAQAFAKPSDADYKAKVLANADLGDQSYEELLSDNDSDDDEVVFKASKSASRDVTFTKELTDFINRYFNHEIKDEEQLKLYFQKAVDAGEVSYKDRYSKLVNLARCYYFYGMWLMSTFDVSNIDQLDLTDNSSSAALNNYAGEFYDRSIEFAQQALDLRKGADAYTTLALTISANCTAKNTSYILANALKIKSYGRKALKYDPLNGGACFLYSAQDIYAPTPFCKLNKGRKAMTKYLTDKNIRKEKFEEFDITCAIAYSWYKKKKYTRAYEWYKKSALLYPNNYSVNNMLKKISDKLN